MRGDRDATTEDAMLGGKLRLLQPRRGHRFGHDAILLAAAVDARPGDSVVELGAGVGAASLALLARVPRLKAFLVEVEPALCELAAKNIVRNGFGEHARVISRDVTATPRSLASAGLAAGTFHHVLMNPPFNDPSYRTSPDALRRRAHAGSERLIHDWIGTATRLLRAAGTLTLIWRADGLATVLNALTNRHGGITVLPIHPAPERPAIRVLVRATKGGRAPFVLLPPLALNDASNRPSAIAEAILRTGAGLQLADQVNRARGDRSTGARDARRR